MPETAAKKPGLKMIADADHRQPIFLGCVEAVDADGFRRVGRPVPRDATVLDFIARAAAPTQAKKQDGNRFRAFQVSDLTATNAHTHTHTFGGGGEVEM